jgi:CHAT domain-containing protein/predicted negative regulator of RcsB-dependent stress response
MEKNRTLPAVIAAVLLGLAMPAAAQPADLGKDAAAESCSLEGKASSNDGAAIVCGKQTVPAGHVLFSALAAATQPARRIALANAARSMIAQQGKTADTLRCDAGKMVDENSLLFVCSAGGWPQVVLAAATPRGVVSVIMLPGLAPLLPTMLAAVARPVPSDSGAALAAAVQAAFPARLLALGAGDFADYRAFVALGRNDGAAGDFAGAEAAWRGALDIALRLFGEDSAAVGGGLIELALQVSNQSRFDEAAALFQRAAPILDQSSASAMRARFAAYRALDAANRRNYGDGLKYARDAVAIRQADIAAIQQGAVDTNGNAPAVPLLLQAELAHDLRVEAEMAMRLGNLPDAQVAAERALSLVSQHPELPISWRADMVSLMGEVNLRQGRTVPAEKNFTDALAMNRKIFADGPATLAAYLRLGRFYAQEQVYAPAIANFREAFAAIAAKPALRAQVVAEQIIPFLTAASAMKDGREKLDTEMFAASQLAANGVTDQTIARMAARRASGNAALTEEIRAAEDAARAETALRVNLAVERARPDNERDTARETVAAAAIPAAAAKAAAALAKVHTDFPAYSKLIDPGIVPLDAMMRAIKPRDAFVSFLDGVGGGYILLVTQSGLTVRPLTVGSADLAADIADLRSAFQPRLGQLPVFSLKSAFALYTALLGPIAPQLAGKTRLVVASGAVLANLPFSLLLTAAPADARDYGRAAWLVRQMAVSQIPSASAFIALHAMPPTTAPRPLLALGNPAFAGTAAPGKALDALASSCQEGGPVHANLLSALLPLPDTAREVQAVARDLNARPEDVLLGPAATEAVLRAKPLDQYAVLYFATHGLLPGELHCQAEPGLALSPPVQGARVSSEDGLLTASEISGLRLNADLVVLSACNTAAAGGTRFGGGALQGLADAFFDAGAHAVLASHWQVPSTATTNLMTTLFAGLSHDPGRDTAEALRQAQLALIAQPATAHPYNWAAFTLLGGS